MNNNLNNNLNNKTIDDILNTTKKEAQNNKIKKSQLDKSGFVSTDISSNFKDFGKDTAPTISNKCNDHVLANKDTMVKILEKRKEILPEKNEHIIIRPAPVPYNKNMPEEITKMDPFAINRNLRAKGKYYTIRDEATYYEIETILKQMRTKYEYFKFNDQHYKIDDIKYQIVELNSYISQTLKYLLLNLLVDFNTRGKKSDIGSPYHQYTPFQIINVELMRILHNKSLNVYRYIMVCELYRKNKRHSVNLYIEIIYKVNKDIVLYDKMYTIGFRNDEQIAFNKLANRRNNNFMPIHNFMDENTDLSILKSDKEVDKMLDNRDKEYDLDYYLRHFKCLNPKSVTGVDLDSITQNDCTSYSNKYKCPGKWDIPCTNDYECPFYMANRNYSNKRGGCKNGYCEMPVNVGNIGYHYMDKNKPLCYNCQKIGKNKNCAGIKCNQCCEEQKNRDLYPDLETPDFAFQNDYTPRIAQKEQLKTRKLKADKML